MSKNQKKKAAKKRKAEAAGAVGGEPPATRANTGGGPGLSKHGWRHPDILQVDPATGKQFCFKFNKDGNCPGAPGCDRLHKCQVRGCNGNPPGHRTPHCPLLSSRGITLS